jgi:hypothetical protein
MIEEIKSRLNWLYAVDGTEKERAAVLAIYDLASAWSNHWRVKLAGRVNGAASSRPINEVQTVDRPMMGL